MRIRIVYLPYSYLDVTLSVSILIVFSNVRNRIRRIRIRRIRISTRCRICRVRIFTFPYVQYMNPPYPYPYLICIRANRSRSVTAVLCQAECVLLLCGGEMCVACVLYLSVFCVIGDIVWVYFIIFVIMLCE